MPPPNSGYSSSFSRRVNSGVSAEFLIKRIIYPDLLSKSLTSKRKGFSIIELLTVLSVLAILATVATPAFNAIKGGSEVSQAASTIASYLELARSHAMAKNTYVFVGVTQTDEKIVVALTASRDGSANRTPNGDWIGNSNLVALDRIIFFKNVKLTDFAGKSASTGPMAGRRNVASAGSLGNSAVGSQTVIAWPLNGGGSEYQFRKVIQFDPQGLARIQDGSSSEKAVQRLEIGLQQAPGSQTPPAVTDLSTGKIAAVQLDGITGTTRVFQP